MTYIVIYSVKDDQVRRRLNSFLRKNGMRLMRATFIVEKKKHAFVRFRDSLAEIVGNTGEIVILRQCRGCKDKAIEYGRKKHKRFYIL